MLKKEVKNEKLVLLHARFQPIHFIDCDYSESISHAQAAVDSLIEENDRLKSQLVSLQGDGVSRPLFALFVNTMGGYN